LWKVCVVVAVLSSAGCSAPHNAVEPQDPKIALQNYDFESGRLQPWQPFQSVQVVVGTDHARNGKFGLEESVGGGSVYQDVKGLELGVPYTVSAWVSTPDGATATAQIAVFDPAANAASFSPAVTTSGEWTRVKHDFKVNSGGVARIHLFRNVGSGTLVWDDVRLARGQ
jgi:hypothetical protein